MFRLTNRTILVLIVVVATVLRLINYFEIPFTHDEFSALSRLNFDDLSTLIKEGVMSDGHPAGIQVFLFYWVRLFGSDEWIVKLPFTLFGLLSVWLVYAIATRWFNETVGLLSAAFFTTIQYTVMYSQIARPYISGVFFSLLMVYHWSSIMQTPGTRFYRNTLLYVISASLCTYNHHFSMLFAMLVGISGLLLVERGYRFRYIMAGLAICVLYIPHLKIFFYQLSVGGVGAWLAKPHNDFFVSYLGYIFNYSLLSLLVTLLVSLYGARGSGPVPINRKHYLLFFSWFIIPLLTGFFYSKYVNAVLQFSVLIFSFTYLLFLLFGHIKSQKAIVNLILVIAILSANTFSLVFKRDHYGLFYNSPYSALLVDHQEAKEMESSTLSIIDSHHRNSTYYSAKLGVDNSSFRWFDSFQDEHDLKCFLESQSKLHTQLYLGTLSSTNPLAVPLIRDYYPSIEWRRDYAGATSYLFSREPESECQVIGKLDFESDGTDHWSSLDTRKYTDSSACSGSSAYLIDEGTQFGPTFSEMMEHLTWSENDFIEISAKVRGDFKTGGQLLVGSLESNGKRVHWGGTPFDRFVPCGGIEDQWITVHHVVKLSDIYLKHNKLRLKVYIWNRGGGYFLVDDMHVSIRTGNPVIYGLTEKF